jgi:hypothetical protein
METGWGFVLLQIVTYRKSWQGLDILFPCKVGLLAMPRLYELVVAANPLRVKG